MFLIIWKAIALDRELNILIHRSMSRPFFMLQIFSFVALLGARQTAGILAERPSPVDTLSQSALHKKRR
jgi:hypothetical protein